MKTSILRPLVVPWVASVIAVLSLASSPRAAADSARPVYYVGLQQDCGRTGMAKIDRAVERALHDKGYSIALLSSTSGQVLPPCQGASCARAFAAACPRSTTSATGLVMGGQIDAGPSVSRFRLWLYDLGSKQIAYQDDYCQGCDVVSAVQSQFLRLLEQPRYGGEVPPTQPSYCAPSAGGSSSVPVARSTPLFLTVYGEGKHKAAIAGAVRSQLTTLGRKVLTPNVESKTYPPEILKRIVLGQRDAQILGIEVPKDGSKDAKVQLWLWDQKTDQIEAKNIDCPDCDKDTLSNRLLADIPALLEHCFGETCTNATASTPAASASSSAPAEACTPWPAPVCAGALGDGGAQLVYAIPPKTATALTALTWTPVAASAVSAVALWIANAAGAGAIENGQYRIGDALARPAWAMTLTSAVLLGVAIPATVAIKRAQTPQPAGATDPASAIRCPE